MCVQLFFCFYLVINWWPFAALSLIEKFNFSTQINNFKVHGPPTNEKQKYMYNYEYGMILLRLLRSPLLWHIDISKADCHSEWKLPKKMKWWQTLIITDEHAYFSFADNNQRPLYIDSHKFVKYMFFLFMLAKCI